MTDTGREPGHAPSEDDDLEAQAADDFYHDRPAADSAQVYDGYPESQAEGDLPPDEHPPAVSHTSGATLKRPPTTDE
jgi:hypothetical protein